MSDQTKIEWTDATWNPTRGCTKISPGCKNCYANSFAERWRGIKNHPFEHGFDLKLVPHKLIEPVQWIKPKHIFVDSMSDLFHENIPDFYIDAIFEIIGLCDWHEFQICTKRSKRMRNFILKNKANLKLDNVWLGVSVENRDHGLPRINHLRDLPAKFRFLSIEPLLDGLGKFDLRGIDWVIVGGETGPGARVMKKEWVYSILNKCENYEIPLFFQQWGAKNRSRKEFLIDGNIVRNKPQGSEIKVTGRPERAEKKKRAANIIKKMNRKINLNKKYRNLLLIKPTN